MVNISVIIATRNRPKDIELCIRSIVENSLVNYEVVVVDQSTNFKTRDFVKGLGDNRIVYRRQKAKFLPLRMTTVS